MKNGRNTRRDRFARDGFFLFEDILDPPLLDRLSRFSDEVLARQAPEHFEENLTTGSMVMIDWAMACRHPVMAELIAHPNALAALKTLGFDEPKFGHGRIISKPAHSPPLFWHEDGRFWNDPVSYTTQPVQCFLMYYLTDTAPQNGCLRVIPGSHLKRHSLHDRIAPRHTDELRKFANPDDPGFSRTDDEVDVPVEAGDLVMGYGSLLHASHANRSDRRRTVLTMWYYPDFVSLPERTRATVASLEAQPVQCFLMYYLTDTAPQNGCLRVIPGSHLKRHSLHDRIARQSRPHRDGVDPRGGSEVRGICFDHFRILPEVVGFGAIPEPGL